MSDKRMTWQTRKVLEALLAEPERERYGLDLSRESGVVHGTLYGILVRLEEEFGWLESRVEYPVERDASPRRKAAPPRRYYRLTRDGAARAHAALAHADRARTRRRPLGPALGAS